MTPTSIDLRERIVAAYLDHEGSFVTLGKRFKVSRSLVEKLVSQYQKLGTLESQVHRRGRKPAIFGEKEKELRQHLEDYPDATLKERIKFLGLNCSEKTMSLTLKRMGWRFKKNRRVPLSRTEKMLRSSVQIGVIHN